MKAYAIKWFKSGRTQLQLASRFRKQGYTSEAAFLGARCAAAYYRETMKAREALPLPRVVKRDDVSEPSPDQRAFFEKRRVELKRERWLERVRSAPIMKDHGAHDAVERFGRHPVVERAPEYEDRRDVVPQLLQPLRRRIA